MPLYRHPKSPYWWARVSVAGRKVRCSTGTADREKAEEFEHVLRDRLWRERKLGERGALSFREAAARWLTETEKATKTADRTAFQWFCAIPELAQSPLNTLDLESINVLRQDLLDEGRAPATVNRWMSILRAMLRKAHLEWGVLDSAPKVPMYAAGLSEPRWLKPDEFRRLTKELPPHLALAAQFAVLTGLRMRSMLSLDWEQIDMKKRRAWIAAKDMKAGKTIGIPLSPAAIKVLREIGVEKAGPVFRWKGKRIDDCNTLAFQKAVERAKVGPLRWHDLRHTFASWAVQGGVTLHELMQLGGWASYTMVLRYAHLAPDHLASAAAKVAQMGHTGKRRKVAA